MKAASARQRRSWMPLSVRRAVLARAGGKCEGCGAPGERFDGAARGLELHHRHAYSLGGEHSAENVVLLCPDCHGEPERYAYSDGVRRAGRPRQLEQRRQVNIYLGDEELAGVRAEAARRGVTMSAVAVDYLRAGLGLAGGSE